MSIIPCKFCHSLLASSAHVCEHCGMTVEKHNDDQALKFPELGTASIPDPVKRTLHRNVLISQETGTDVQPSQISPVIPVQPEGSLWEPSNRLSKRLPRVRPQSQQQMEERLQIFQQPRTPYPRGKPSGFSSLPWPVSFPNKFIQSSTQRRFKITPLTSIIASLIIAGLIGTLLLSFVAGAIFQPQGQSKPTLTINDPISSGGTVTLHGRGFAPGGAVTLSLDGGVLALIQRTVTLASYPMNTNTVSALIAQQTKQVSTLSQTTVVKSDGTFDVTITLPMDWQLGSHHTLQATEQSNQGKISARIDLVFQSPAKTPAPSVTPTLTPTSTPSPTPSVTPTSTPTPSPTPTSTSAMCLNATPTQLAFVGVANQSDAAPQTITIANCGSTGNWSAMVSTDSGGNWLSASALSGTLKGGTSRYVTITASNLIPRPKLNIGTYTGHITFTMGSSSAKVNVTLTVSPAPCLQTSTSSLNFSGQTADLTPQTVTLTNCGGAGTWSAVVTTTSGGNWLSITPTTSTLNGGSMEMVSISASGGSPPCGMSYTGHIAITLTTSAGPTVVGIDVTLMLMC